MTNEQLQLGENGQIAPTQAHINPEADRVAGLCNLILDLLHYSPVITAQEWATAVNRTANCTNTATLAKWYRNAVVEVANREETHATASTTYATLEQKQEVIRLLNHPAITRRHKTRVLLSINSLSVVDARDHIAALTAYIAAPFGGGAVGAAHDAVSYSRAA